MADPKNLSDEQILAKVIAQPESAQLAESLGMELEDYAQRVLFYVRNPKQQPMIEVMSDDEAREAGMPSPEECATFLGRAIDAAEREQEAHYAGFDDDEKSAATTTGGTGKKRAPKLGEARGAVLGDDELAHEVTDARRRHAAGGSLAEAARLKEARGGKSGEGKPVQARSASKKAKAE
ncbi:MAG: hypothetical protein A2138_00530 [Deltaproteobacteria bacterium RBG_16_71_12]|nr:MAG: hypothetical protein A2138_00530 [Deltaproteobacteria bacterium RBG_16_71_12]